MFVPCNVRILLRIRLLESVQCCLHQDVKRAARKLAALFICALVFRERSQGGETTLYRLGLGAVFCAEVCDSRTLVIRRTSTRRFLARPSAVVLGSAALSLP